MYPHSSLAQAEQQPCTVASALFLSSPLNMVPNIIFQNDVPVRPNIIELANYEVPRSENSTPPNRGIYFWGSGTRVKFLHTQFQLYVTDSFILVYTSTIFFLGYILSGEIQCMHACIGGFITCRSHYMRKEPETTCTVTSRNIHAGMASGISRVILYFWCAKQVPSSSKKQHVQTFEADICYQFSERKPTNITWMI